MNYLVFLNLLVILSIAVGFSHQTVIRTFRSRAAKSHTALPQRSLCNYNGAKSHKAGEFYQLPSRISPKRYRLRLRLDARRQKLYGHSLISIYLHNQTNIIELNSVKLTINGASFRTRNIRVDSGMVYYCPEKETVVLYFHKPLHKGGGNLTINFSGNLTEMMHSGFLKTQDDDRNIVMADFGPTEFRRMAPSWDEPLFKAHFDLYLIVPRGHQALFNLPANRRRAYSPEFEEIRFESTPLFSTFQLATITAPKLHATALPKTANSSTDDVSLQIYSPYLRQTGEWHYALETSEKLLHYFQYYFDYKYPLSKLDFMALSNYGQTSIEKLGLIFFSEQQLLIANRSLASEEELKGVAETLAHSLAHQWIGNLVTFKQWDEFWLFEGLAFFLEKEAVDSLFPHWRIWERFTGDKFRKGLQTDASRYAKPLDRLINHPKDILQFYPNENSYFKAVSLFRMLRSAIGEETFQKGIRLFVKTHANQTATADDLWRSFQMAIGKVGKDEFAQFQLEVVQGIANWTRMAGYPILHVDERQEGEIRVIKLRQERFVESSLNLSDKMIFSNAANVWPIPLSFINSFNPFSPSHQAIITDQYVELQIGEIWEGEWVKVNPEFANFYRVSYSEDMLDKFAISVEEKLLASMDRLNLVDDLFALIRAGHVGTDVGLRFLWSYENEDNPNVWAVIVAAMGDLDTLISSVAPSTNDTLREKYRKYGRHLLTKMYGKLWWYQMTTLPLVGQKMRVDDFAQDRLRENILCLMGRLKAANFTEVASGKFTDYIQGESDLPIGLLECVFRAFSDFPAFKNQSITFQQLFQYYKEYDVSEARHLFSIALGSTEKTLEIKRVIDFSLESIVRPEDTHTMLKEISAKSAEGRNLVMSKINSKFFHFVQKFHNFNSMHHFLKDILESFSIESEVTQLEKLLSEHAQLKVLLESLRYSFEKVTIFERWIKRDQGKMLQFFDKAHLQSELLDEDDDDLFSGSNPNAIEDHFFDFEEFDKKKKKKK